MSIRTTASEYMVLSRGTTWDESVSPEDIQNVTKQFYGWLERLIDGGKSKGGRRVAPEGSLIIGRY
jgi:hypothetical protein